MRVLLLSTYELGHQPVSVGSCAAALLAAGHQARCVDVAVDRLGVDDVDWAEGVALSVPMHTAMRLALRVADTLRARRPGLPLCLFGLYAGMDGDRPALAGVRRITGEFEAGVVAWADADGSDGSEVVTIDLGRNRARLPARDLLPGLDRYTRLAVGGERRLVGSVAASRGCVHRCRHCPVPVVYDGRVRPVAEEAVLADIDGLVAAGVGHISFADPDFLNTPQHARRVVAAMVERHPDLSFDATVKVEHLLRHPDVVADLAASGCAFVVSAFESVSDRILGVVDKGHSAGDLSAAVIALRAAGIEIRPSWLPFTPWTTWDDLVGLVDFVVAHDLVANVDPVQYSIRLLVPAGSLLVGEAAMLPHLGAYDPARLGWTWAHPDPAVDRLQADLAALVEAASAGERATDDVFEEVDARIRAAAAAASGAVPARPVVGSTSTGPPGPRARLTEPWFCCSEPTEAQLAPLAPLG